MVRSKNPQPNKEKNPQKGGGGSGPPQETLLYSKRNRKEKEDPFPTSKHPPLKKGKSKEGEASKNALPWNKNHPFLMFNDDF